MASDESRFDAQELIDASPLAISVIDTNAWRVDYQNPRGKELLSNIVGKSCHRNIAGFEQQCPFCRAPEALEKKKTTYSEVPMPDGRWLLVQWAPIVDQGKLKAVETITDITEQKEQEEEYRRLKDYFEGLSITDPLTETLNRRGLYDAVERVCRRREAPAAEGQYVQVIMLDIDSFKGVNDSYGHKRGDQVLRHIAKILRQSVRIEDLICRWGGEEFLVVVLSPSQIPSVAPERLRANIEASVVAPGSVEEEPISVTVSVGAAFLSLSEFSIEEFDRTVEKVDERLYRAKAAGRNCVRSEEADEV